MRVRNRKGLTGALLSMMLLVVTGYPAIASEHTGETMETETMEMETEEMPTSQPMRGEIQSVADDSVIIMMESGEAETIAVTPEIAAMLTPGMTLYVLDGALYLDEMAQQPLMTEPVATAAVVQGVESNIVTLVTADGETETVVVTEEEAAMLTPSMTVYVYDGGLYQDETAQQPLLSQETETMTEEADFADTTETETTTEEVDFTETETTTEVDTVEEDMDTDMDMDDTTEMEETEPVRALW